MRELYFVDVEIDGGAVRVRRMVRINPDTDHEILIARDLLERRACCKVRLEHIRINTFKPSPGRAL